MTNVLQLPNAAPERVDNPRVRGRYPANVVRIPYYVEHPRENSRVIITTDANYGIEARIVRIQQAGRKGGETTYVLESLGRPFRGLKFTESGEPASDDICAEFARRCFRIAYQRRQTEPPRYSIPAWPQRWERNLKKLDGGSK